MNRPQGIVSFEKPQLADKELNGWSSDVNALLSVIDKTNHLIEKEEMIHSIALAN